MRSEMIVRQGLPLTGTNQSVDADVDLHATTFDPNELGRIILRRKWLIILTIFVLMAVATATVLKMTPRYSAEALLLVSAHQPTLLDIQAAVAGSDIELTESQIEIVRSRRIAKLVVEKLDLTKNPLVNPLIQRSWVNRIWQTGRDIIASIGGRNNVLVETNGSGVLRDVATPATIDALLKHLEVAARGRSRAVSVSFDSPSPALAAAVANATVNQYIGDRLDRKIRDSEQANRWLSERVGELRAQVVEADRAVQGRKSAAGIAQGRQGGLIAEQMSSMSDQLIQAESELARAEARLQQARRAGAHDSVSEVLSSLLIQRLRTDRAELERKIASARETLGERNPALMKLKAELDGLNNDLHREVAKIIASLQSEVDAARAREAAMRRNFNELRVRATNIQGADVDIDAAQREAAANHALFDRVLARSKEASIESGLQNSNAEVIAYADVPERPSYPNKLLFLSSAFATALVAAGLLVYFAENTDEGFRDLDGVERVLKVPALGFAPALRRRAGSPTPDTFALERPLSLYAEAIRGIYTSVMVSGSEPTPKCILVTSALPGEGKTSIAVSLARLMAASGKQVLLIDGDLRRRTASEIMVESREPGLVELLSGKVSLADVIARDPLSGASVLPAGSYPSNPPEVLSSRAMRDLLATLTNAYDLVIIDSAPVLAVSDTRTLCRLADKIVVAMRWQRTRRAAAAPTIRHIRNAGGDIAGVLLTIADTKKLAAHSSSYYLRQLHQYMPD